jgi:hypothetical protein
MASNVTSRTHPSHPLPPSVFFLCILKHTRKNYKVVKVKVTVKPESLNTFRVLIINYEQSVEARARTQKYALWNNTVIP